MHLLGLLVKKPFLSLLYTWHLPNWPHPLQVGNPSDERLSTVARTGFHVTCALERLTIQSMSHGLAAALRSIPDLWESAFLQNPQVIFVHIKIWRTHWSRGSKWWRFYLRRQGPLGEPRNITSIEENPAPGPLSTVGRLPLWPPVNFLLKTQICLLLYPLVSSSDQQALG